MSRKDKEKLFDETFKLDLLFETTWKMTRAFKIFLMFAVFYTFFTVGFVPSNSMSPAMVKGDALFIKLGNNNLNRGDIISFINPYDNSESYTKRIIGLPGESIEIKDCRIYINSLLLEEEYVDSFPPYCPDQSLVIPEGEYYVLGDNRWDSVDSMTFGTIKEETIRGRVLSIFSLEKLYKFLEKRFQ